MSDTMPNIIHLYDALMRAGNFNSKDELFAFIEKHAEEIKRIFNEFKDGAANG